MTNDARPVDAFLHDAAARTPHIKAVTLSSTHLPWLRDYMTAGCPTMRLLDPLDDVIARLGDVTTVGTGTTIGLVTQTAKYPVNRFSAMLARLDIHIPFTVVNLDPSLPPASR